MFNDFEVLNKGDLIKVFVGKGLVNAEIPNSKI